MYKSENCTSQNITLSPLNLPFEMTNAAIAATRKSQVGTGDRSGKIRTYNFPQNRVTDHRLTGDNKNFNIAAIINGDLDGMIDALTLNDQAQRLQEGKES